MSIMSGKSWSVNKDSIEQWLSDLPTLLKNYKFCDTIKGLFF